MKNARSVLVVAATALLGLGLAGCGGSSSVDGAKVADKVSATLTKKVGQKPDKVTCPDLKGKKGEKVTCELTAKGKTYDTVVTVTSVVDGVVNLDIKVADTAR